MSRINICGEEMGCGEAIRAGWEVLRHMFESVGIRSRENMAERKKSEGFSQPRWSAHFSGRVQERILNMAIVRDARAVAFESVYVQVAVHACQQVVRLQDSHPHGTRRSEPEPQESRPSSVTPWESLDHISVNDVSNRRFGVLQRCPAHLRGRWRQSVRVALEARHHGISTGHGTQELQGWKLFCLLPFWLLRRPRSKGNVGKAELTKRFDLFGEASGRNSTGRQPRTFSSNDNSTFPCPTSKRPELLSDATGVVKFPEPVNA